MQVLKYFKLPPFDTSDEKDAKLPHDLEVGMYSTADLCLNLWVAADPHPEGLQAVDEDILDGGGADAVVGVAVAIAAGAQVPDSLTLEHPAQEHTSSFSS